MSACSTTIGTPIGPLRLTGDGRRLRGLHFVDARGPAAAPESATGAFAVARAQLAAYFAGELTGFELELDLHGTPFQQRVWAELQRIPYGETISYGELARRVGAPGAARAVGLANGQNPVSIVVPCHRVIGADGSLTGYGGGLGRKRALLTLEAARVRPMLPV